MTKIDRIIAKVRPMGIENYKPIFSKISEELKQKILEKKPMERLAGIDIIIQMLRTHVDLFPIKGVDSRTRKTGRDDLRKQVNDYIIPILTEMVEEESKKNTKATQGRLKHDQQEEKIKLFTQRREKTIADRRQSIVDRIRQFPTIVDPATGLSETVELLSEIERNKIELQAARMIRGDNERSLPIVLQEARSALKKWKLYFENVKKLQADAVATKFGGTRKRRRKKKRKTKNKRPKKRKTKNKRPKKRHTKKHKQKVKCSKTKRRYL